jgi:hypothetical protein
VDGASTCGAHGDRDTVLRGSARPPCEGSSNAASAATSPAPGDLVDDQGFATWFAQPSDWLNGSAPLDLFASRPESVVEAAARTRHALAMRRVAH